MRTDHAAAETASATPGCYDKPIWTLPSLARALGGLPHHLLRVAPTLIGRPIDNRLREMVMLAVATENRCWYCQTAHAAFGEATGLAHDEVVALLSGTDGQASPAEQAALRYVRDLARRSFQSRDEQLWSELRGHFDEPACVAIESTAHVMNFANRFGNTFDAARTRARGGCDATSASWADLLAVSALFVPAAACVAPVVGVLRVGQLVRQGARGRRVGGG